MSSTTLPTRQAVSWKAVQIDDPFWNPRIHTLVHITLLSQWKQLKSSGRLAALGIWDKPEVAPKPHIYFDSDIAKWLEAVAYTQVEHPDEKLRKLGEAIIDGYKRLQWPNGYLNQAFDPSKPERCWTNLQIEHELYCAGHLMEAAVAWFEATGDDKFLRVMIRNAECIWNEFGPDGKPGYSGHPEIELALVRLSQATGEERWKYLAKLMLNRRGTEPHYFEIEAKQREASSKAKLDHTSYQAHSPLREQTTLEGHSVRALYLLAGMVDLSLDDETLRPCTQQLWENAIQKRMYITGGFGSHCSGERFTVDYDLPNREAYAETCASIAGVFVARRMLTQQANGRDADVLERCLYNGMLVGYDLDGEHYFYANPLSTQPGVEARSKRWLPCSHNHLKRKAWYGTSCCPPNVARLLAHLGNYIYDIDDSGLLVHLYIGGKLTHEDWVLEMKSQYVDKGTAQLSILHAPRGKQSLRLRIPQWSTSTGIKINGKPTTLNTCNGYAVLTREWQKGDLIEIQFDLKTQRIFADPRVTDNANKVALQRGPLVYCMEQCDHSEPIASLRLPKNTSFKETRIPSLGQHGKIIECEGVHLTAKELYANQAPQAEATTLRFIPYHLWGHREAAAMQVWINLE